MRGKRTSFEKKEEIKSLLVLNPGITLKEVAQQTESNISSVHDIKKELLNDDDFQKLRNDKKKELIQRSLDIAAAYTLHMMDPAVIDKAGARDSAIVAGTMIDKAQLLAGEATIISERREATADLVAEMEQKLVKLKKMTGT